MNVAHHEDERNTMYGVLDMLIEQGLEGTVTVGLT